MSISTLTETEPRLRTEVVRQLDFDPEVDASAIGVSARDGVVTLTGFVPTYTDKLAAERIVKGVRGVRGVFNHIVVRAGSAERDVRHRIVEALHRNADLDARHIPVAVDDTVATLTGTVGSFAQYEAAGRTAGAAPGITDVENRLEIGIVD